MTEQHIRYFSSCHLNAVYIAKKQIGKDWSCRFENDGAFAEWHSAELKKDHATLTGNMVKEQIT